MFIAYILGFFGIPFIAMKMNIEPQWILLYFSIWCAGVIAGSKN